MDMDKVQRAAYYDEVGIQNVFEIGDYYLGTYRVIFGFRVRGGRIGDLVSCDIDLCCGDNFAFLMATRALYINIALNNVNNGRKPLDGLPTWTETKPCYLDAKYTAWLSKKLVEGFDTTLTACELS